MRDLDVENIYQWNVQPNNTQQFLYIYHEHYSSIINTIFAWDMGAI